MTFPAAVALLIFLVASLDFVAVEWWPPAALFAGLAAFVACLFFCFVA